ncbi:hypothetical protein OAG24_01100 [bacterium]|nr:hypothetical protein [bacterium]
MSIRGRDPHPISFEEACGMLLMTYDDTDRNFDLCKDLLKALDRRLTRLEFLSSKDLEVRLLTEKDYAGEIICRYQGLIDTKNSIIDNAAIYLCLRIKPNGSLLTGTNRDKAMREIREFLAEKSSNVVQGLYNHFTKYPNNPRDLRHLVEKMIDEYDGTKEKLKQAREQGEELALALKQFDFGEK